MTADLEQRLRDALHEDAERAHLLHPDAPPALDAQRLAVDQRRRRPRKLVAVAAVVALLALVGALAALDDDQQVDTVPPVTAPGVPRSYALVTGGACPFGIAEEDIMIADPVTPGQSYEADWTPGPVDAGAPRFDTADDQTVGHTALGPWTIEVHVPGHERAIDEGWREETIQLERGPVTLWLDGPPSGPDGEPFVQARSFPAPDEPCSSFTVTVDGGTEDTNRQLAAAFAERLLLPAELQGLDPSAGDVQEAGPVGEPPVLPDPGEQPADAEVAEEQVRAAFLGLMDASHTQEDRARFVDRPEVWRAANQALVDGEYGATVADQRAQVEEVVFTDPTNAVVRFQLIGPDGSILGDQTGDALLLDGRWVVAISTPCRMMSVAGVTCDMGL